MRAAVARRVARAHTRTRAHTHAHTHTHAIALSHTTTHAPSPSPARARDRTHTRTHAHTRAHTHARARGWYAHTLTCAWQSRSQPSTGQHLFHHRRLKHIFISDIKTALSGYLKQPCAHLAVKPSRPRAKALMNADPDKRACVPQMRGEWVWVCGSSRFPPSAVRTRERGGGVVCVTLCVCVCVCVHVCARARAIARSPAAPYARPRAGGRRLGALTGKRWRAHTRTQARAHSRARADTHARARTRRLPPPATNCALLTPTRDAAGARRPGRRAGRVLHARARTRAEVARARIRGVRAPARASL